MVWLTDLATVVRAAGLPVVEVFGWLTRGHGGMGNPLGIVCHHTAGAPTGDYPSLSVVRDGRPGLPGPLSQLGLGRSGNVYVIAAGLAWHAGEGRWPGLTGNWDCIGIEAESIGDGSDWTAEQRDAYPRLCAALADAYSIDPALIIAHREWSPERKIDPTGINMPDLRATVRSILDGHSGEGGGTPIDPPTEEEESMPHFVNVIIPPGPRDEAGELLLDVNGRPLNLTPIGLPQPDSSGGIKVGEVWVSLYAVVPGSSAPFNAWAERSGSDGQPQQVWPGAWVREYGLRARSSARLPAGTHGLAIAHDCPNAVGVLVEIDKAT